MDILTTPKEKAIELIKKFEEYCFHNFDNDADEQRFENAKECALILANEMLKESITQLSVYRTEYWDIIGLELRNLKYEI